MLSKEQRIEIYQKAINYLQTATPDYCYICYALSSAISNETTALPFIYMKQFLPELWSVRPLHSSKRSFSIIDDEECDNVWFYYGDTESRIELLQKAIELCNQ